jgi:hypothetical protein
MKLDFFRQNSTERRIGNAQHVVTDSQTAPGLKVSPRAFGMGRRVPIAQRFRG